MRRLVVLLALLLSMVAAGWAVAATPQAGEDAPAFRLQDQNGHWHTPRDFHGSWLVLYFYPRDFTPGCTTEVCAFRDGVAALRKAGARVVGISLDDKTSHARFAETYHVPFPLLADVDHQAATRYGVLTSRSGKHYARRSTFLIDPQGRIARVYADVDPERNAAQVLDDLVALKSVRR